MREEVIISIKANQLYEEQEPGDMELISAGTLEQTEDGYNISYEESELTGMEGTTTTLQVREGQVTLLRQGGLNSVMIFERGRQHVSLYDTPMGSLTVGVNTQLLRTDLGPQGGTVEIRYSIDIEHGTVSQNLLLIRVAKPAQAPA